MNTIQAAIAEIVAEALRDAAAEIHARPIGTPVDAWLRGRADRVAAGLTP